jgi:putative membrane protein
MGRARLAVPFLFGALTLAACEGHMRQRSNAHRGETTSERAQREQRADREAQLEKERGAQPMPYDAPSGMPDDAPARQPAATPDDAEGAGAARSAPMDVTDTSPGDTVPDTDGAERGATTSGPLSSSGDVGGTGATGTLGADARPLDADARARAAEETTQLDDGAVGQIMLTLNTGEVEVARAALPLLQAPAAKAFAQHMIDDHGKNKKELVTIMKNGKIAAKESSISKALQDDGQRTIAQMRAAGKDIDTVFMAAMVTDHQSALKMIDDRLVPAAKDAKMRAYLEKTRGAVADHVTMAERVAREIAPKE